MSKTTEYQEVLQEMERVTAHYEKRLRDLERKADSGDVTPDSDSPKGPVTTEALTGDILHDIETDHELTASEEEKIRHSSRVTFRDIFRSLLMANEPQQRVKQ